MVLPILAVGAATQLLGSGLQAYGQYKSANFNADMMRWQANTIMSDAAVASGDIRKESAKIQGAQIAAYAGQNVDVSSDVVGAVTAETAASAEEDVKRTMLNAQREAWSLRTNADMTKKMGRFQAASSLLGGVGGVASIAGMA